MKKFSSSWMIVPAVALLGFAAACADTAVTAPQTTARATTTAITTTLTQTTTTETKVNQATLGDTVVTVFRLGSSTDHSATITLGFRSSITFPHQVGSICDPLLSSYGAGTWNDDCTTLKTNITITARTWLNAKGKLVTDFQPALRFDPNRSSQVTITLKDDAIAGTRIDFCTLSGCVNEAISDPSLATKGDTANGFVTRIIKHFSGYTVIAD